MIEAVPVYVLLLGHVAAVACGIVAIQAWPKTGRPAPVRLAGVATGCLVLAILTFVVVDPQYPFWDYRTAYYPAGKAVLDDPASLAALMGKGVNGFVNLPIVAYLFAPFSLLSLRYAIGLFTLIGLATTVVAWLLLVRLAGLKGAERWLLLLLFVANGPLQYSLKEGNTSHWVLAALAGGLYLLRAGRPVAAGALLGAAAVLKLPLLLFGAYFVLRRNWRGTLGFAAVCARWDSSRSSCSGGTFTCAGSTCASGSSAASGSPHSTCSRSKASCSVCGQRRNCCVTGPPIRLRRVNASPDTSWSGCSTSSRLDAASWDRRDVRTRRAGRPTLERTSSSFSSCASRW